jgi:hypothetical protein
VNKNKFKLILDFIFNYGNMIIGDIMQKAEEILNKHIDAHLKEIEILITDGNRRDILPLYRDYHKMGFSPNVEERNGQHYLVANISSAQKSNVIDISVRKNQSQVIEVDFSERKVISRG